MNALLTHSRRLTEYVLVAEPTVPLVLTTAYFAVCRFFTLVHPTGTDRIAWVNDRLHE
jgi:hypothetical protein